MNRESMLREALKEMQEALEKGKTKNEVLELTKNRLALDDALQEISSYPFAHGCLNSDIDDLSDKDIHIFWSGGCDSTALILALAAKYPDKQLHTFSVYHENIPNADTDRLARKRLKEKFQEIGIYLDHSEITISDNVWKCSDGGLGQPVSWLSALTAISGRNRAICFAYVAEDCIWHVIHEFKQVFHGIAKITNTDAVCCFPFENVTKKCITRILENAGLLEYCNWCEGRKAGEEPCNSCDSCKRQNEAIEELEKEGFYVDGFCEVILDDESKDMLIDKMKETMKKVSTCFNQNLAEISEQVKKKNTRGLQKKIKKLKGLSEAMTKIIV